MSRIWIDKNKFLKTLPHSIDDALRPAMENYSTVSPEKAKTKLSPDLYAAYEAVAADAEGAVEPDAVRDRYVDSVTAGVHEAAGNNRWLSIIESRQLPATTKKAYDGHRARQKSYDRFVRSLDEPFPDGDHSNLIGRHLPMVRKRTMQALIDVGDMSKGVVDLKSKLADAGDELTTKNGLQLELTDTPKVGKSKLTYPPGDAPYVVVTDKTNDRTLVVGSKDDGFELALYEGKSTYSDLTVNYSAQSPFEGMEELMAKLPVKMRKSLERRTSETEKIDGRFTGGTDVECVTMLGTTLAHALRGGQGAKTIEHVAAKKMKHHDALAAELFKRSGAFEAYEELVSLSKQVGEQCLGDADLTIKVGNRGGPQGAKKVLRLENHASSLSLFVDLAAMKQGELRVEANYEGDDRGMLHIDKDGGLISMPHFRSISSIDFQLGWALDEMRDIAKHAAG